MVLRLAFTTPLALMVALSAAPGSAQPAPQPGPLQADPLKGVDLDFTRGVPLKEVFQRLGKGAGVKILLHASVAEQADAPVTGDFRDLAFQPALDTLMLQNNLFYTVQTPRSIMVFKKTPQNLQEFEPRTLRTFQLSHGSADSLRQTFNALYPSIRVMVDHRLNAVTVLARAAEMGDLERIAATQDQPAADLELEFQLIEVSYADAKAAGLMLGPDCNVPRGLKLLKQNGKGHWVACPKVRTTSGEKAEIHLDYPDVPVGAVWIVAKPRLLPDGDVSMRLEYHVRDLIPSGEADRLLKSERTLASDALIPHDQVALFGGLLDDGGSRDKKDLILVIRANKVATPSH